MSALKESLSECTVGTRLNISCIYCRSGVTQKRFRVRIVARNTMLTSQVPYSYHLSDSSTNDIPGITPVA